MIQTCHNLINLNDVISAAKADYTSDEDEEEDEGSDIEKSRAKRLEKAKTALRDSDEESEKSKRSSRLYILIISSLCSQVKLVGQSFHNYTTMYLFGLKGLKQRLMEPWYVNWFKKKFDEGGGQYLQNTKSKNVDVLLIIYCGIFAILTSIFDLQFQTLFFILQISFQVLVIIKIWIGKRKRK